MSKNSFPSLSVSKTSLLSNGSDAKFRRFLYDLFTLAALVEMVRREFSRKIGIAPSNYGILRAIAERHRHGGITVSEITDTLHMHNSFVVLQTGLLAKSGILARKPNPRDRRSVLLHLTKKGEALIEAIGPAVRLTNDNWFGWIDKKDFERLSADVAKLGEQGQIALDTLRLTFQASPRRPRNIRVTRNHVRSAAI